MRKLFAFAAAAIFFAASCQPEERASSAVAENEKEFPVRAGGLLGEWSPGDSLTMVDNLGCHVFKAAAAGAEVPFSGQAYTRSRSRIAVYPCVQGCRIDDASFRVEAATSVQREFIPAEAAYCIGNVFSMKDLAAAIKISVVSDDVESVSITPVGGGSLSGHAVFSFSASGSMSLSHEGGEAAVQLLPPEGERFLAPGEHYISCLPGSFAKGLHFTAVRKGDRDIDTVIPSAALHTGKVFDAGVIEDGMAPPLQPVDIDILFLDNADGAKFQWPFRTPSESEISSSFSEEASSFVRQVKDFVMPDKDGGYTVTMYSSTGFAKHSTMGLRMGGKAGDYIDLPVIRGRYLTGVTVVGGNVSSALRVENKDGSPVMGGNLVSSFGEVGASFSWTLYDSELSGACRLVADNASAIAIRRISLHYAMESVPLPQEDVSPLDLGLRQAASGTERFSIIRKAHLLALAIGRQVDYTGVGTVDLEIPSGAPSIPVGENTDFKGTVFNVLNKSKDINLFLYNKTRKSIALSGAQIDSKDFTSVPQLNNGLYLLIVEDKTPWVIQRENHDYGANRVEAILVRDGVAYNGPIAPYNTPASVPVCSYIEVDDSQKTFCNVTLYRDPASIFRTFLVRMESLNNMKISNVTINTPDAGGMIGDAAIRVHNSTNLLMEDVTVNGSYSKTDTYGYGISLNGIWNSTYRRITSHTDWGVFGCNNMHDSVIEDCNIDRFDTHCYGRNITVRNSTVTGRGLPVSSVFGTILLEHNTYVSCYPYSIRADYFTYIPMDIVIKDCEMTAGGAWIFPMGRLDNVIAERPEREKKCWHNVTIDGFKVHVPKNATTMSLYRPSGSNTYGKPLGYLSKIDIKRLEFIYPSGASSVDFNLSSVNATLENSLDCKFDSCTLAAPGSSSPVRVTLNLKGPQDTHSVTDSDITIVE